MSYVQIRQSQHSAHKEYRCVWCGQIISVGERYERELSTFYGQLQQHAWHVECSQVAKLHFASGVEEFSPHEHERPILVAA